LAWLTYRLIEKPFRFGNHSRAKTLILIALMTLVGFVGFNCYKKEGYAFRLPAEVQMYVQTIDFQFAKFIRYGQCHLETDEVIVHDKSCVESARPLVALWGDSHASALYPGLKKIQEESDFGIMQLTTAACPPLLQVGTYSVLRKKCDAANHNVIDLLIRNKPDVLIMNSAFIVPGGAYTWDESTLVSKLDETLKFIKSKLQNTKVVVIGPAPQWQESPQKVSFLFWKNSLDKKERIPVSQKATVFPTLDNSLKQITESNGAAYISAIQHLCNADRCISRIGDNPESFIAVDYGHLSKAGSEYFVGKIKQGIFRSFPSDFKSKP
ncbi:MAG: SGNH hydrolase domain-containing protein, partial [Patescibacteria group bacterium]